jgi:hypothetical protein
VILVDKLVSDEVAVSSQALMVIEDALRRSIEQALDRIAWKASRMGSFSESTLKPLQCRLKQHAAVQH